MKDEPALRSEGKECLRDCAAPREGKDRETGLKMKNEGLRRERGLHFFNTTAGRALFSFLILHFSFLIPAAGQLPDSLPLAERYPAEMLPTVYYTEGVKLATEEDLTGAVEQFVQALALEPDHDPSLYETANALMMMGDLPKALEYSSRAVELDPANVWYKGQKARLLVFTERYDEALPLFESMLGDSRAFDPDNYRILSLLYHQQGRIDEAVATLDSAEMRMGRSPEVAELKRSILIDAGRVDDAVAVTEAYVEATPYDEENRLVLSDLYAYRGQDSLRVAMLKEVLDINPNNVAALTNLGDHYVDKGQTSLYFATLKQIFLLDEVSLDEKLEYFDKLTRNSNFYRQHFPEISDLALVLITHYPGNVQVVEKYSDHMIRGGDIEGALMMLKTQLEKPDAPVSTFLQVVEIEAYLQRPDSVAVYSDRALARYPGEMDIYLLKSGALQYMKRYKESRKVLEQSLKIAQTDSLRSQIYGSIGTVWHEEGNMKKTFSNYEKALKYDKNNILVLNNYAYFLALEERDLDRALGMASRAIKLQENSATYLDTYAWVLYKLGNYAEAKKVMQQALPLDRTNSSELLIHYGDILYAMGDNFMATVYWKRARDAGYEPLSEIEERLSRTGTPPAK